MRRIAALLTVGVIAAACAPTAAPSPTSTKPPVRIGVIFGIARELATPRLDALREGLAALGYQDGRDITFEVRFLEGQDIDGAVAIVRDLIQGGVKMIVTGNPTGVEGARKATTTVPIVLAGVGPNPVGQGWVASLDKPGGNLTGLSYQVPTTHGRRLQLIRDIVGSDRIGVLNDATAGQQVLGDIQAAAKPLELSLKILIVKDVAGANAALAEFKGDGIRGVFATVGSALPLQLGAINGAALADGVALTWGIPEGARAGGLLGLGPDQLDLYRRAAAYIDKILKGANPGDLPLEQPRAPILVLNLKTAQTLGLTIPQSILAQADEVIR